MRKHISRSHWRLIAAVLPFANEKVWDMNFDKVGSNRLNVVQFCSAPLPFAWEDLVMHWLFTVNSNFDIGCCVLGRSPWSSLRGHLDG